MTKLDYLTKKVKELKVGELDEKLIDATNNIFKRAKTLSTLRKESELND